MALRVRAVLLASLILAGCTQPAQDGYAFTFSEFERPHVRVTLKRYPTPEALMAEAERLHIYPDPGHGLAAWSQIGREEARCTIHIVDPAILYRPDLLGHELMHCMFGRWHF